VPSPVETSVRRLCSADTAGFFTGGFGAVEDDDAGLLVAPLSCAGLFAVMFASAVVNSLGAGFAVVARPVTSF
jgi:hypothetical protein